MFQNFDVPTDPSHAKPRVAGLRQKMKEAGFTKATGTYGIDRGVTRAETAVFMARAFLGLLV